MFPERMSTCCDTAPGHLSRSNGSPRSVVQMAASLASATCCPGTKPPTGSGGAAAASPPGRGPMASSSSRRLSFWTGWPISCRRRGSTGIAITECSPRITSSGLPSRPSRSGMSASGAMPRLMGMRSADMRRAEMPPPTAATHATNRPPTTPPGLRGPNSWLEWARRFLLRARGVAATFGSEETAGRSRLTSNRRFASGRRPGWLRPREVSPARTSANHSSRLASLPLVARTSTGAS